MAEELAVWQGLSMSTGAELNRLVFHFEGHHSMDT